MSFWDRLFGKTNEPRTQQEKSHAFECGVERGDRRAPEAKTAASELKPQSLTPDKLLEKGFELEKQRKVDEAISCYEQAIALKSDLRDAWLGKARCLPWNDHQARISCYDRVIAIDPVYRDAWFQKGNSLFFLDRNEEALSCYTRTIALDPSSSGAWASKGRILWGMGRHEEGLASLDRALELRPDDSFTAAFLCDCHETFTAGKSAIKIREVARLATHNDWVLGVTFSPDGRFAASCDDGGSVHLYEVKSRRQLAKASVGRSAYSVCFSDDCERLVCAAETGAAVFEVSSMRVIASAGGSYNSAAFLPGQGGILLGDNFGVRLWPGKGDDEAPSFEPSGFTVKSIALSKDGSKALSGGGGSWTDKERLRVWDVGSARMLRPLQGHTDLVLSVALSAQGKIGLSGGDDSTLILWDVASGSQLAKSSTGKLLVVALSPTGDLGASGGFDGTVSLWDTKSVMKRGRLAWLRCECSYNHGQNVYGLAFSPDGKHLLSAGKDQDVRLLEIVR